MTEAIGPVTPDQVHEWVRHQLAPFFAASVNPGAADRDATGSPLPVEAFRPAAELDLFGYLLPVAHGGAGGDRRTFGLLLEQIGYFCDELEYASLLSMYADIPTVIVSAGQPELIDRYLPKMRKGRCFGTFAYTERTDAFDFRCRVSRNGDGYLIDGEKCLQTGGDLADVFSPTSATSRTISSCSSSSAAIPGSLWSQWRPPASGRPG